MPRDKLTFEVPGPGTWMLDTQHYPTPMSPFLVEYKPGSVGTINRTMERRGDFTTFDLAVVNGFYYNQISMIGVKPGSGEAPSVDHLEVQRCIARTLEVYKTRFWRDELRRWNEEVKPDSISKNTALAEVDVKALSRDELLEHVARCRDNTIEMSGRHHQFTDTSTLPASLLMADLAEWTDLPFEDALSLLDGATPIASGVTPELIALAEAIRDDEQAQSVLDSGSASENVIKELQSLPGKGGDAMRQFLLVDGHRLATGFDVTATMALELPDIMVFNIKKVVESGAPDRSAEASVLARFVRNMVPEKHRNSFDNQLADARDCISLKDERGLYNDVWSGGIVRKALLEAGRRLVQEGRIADREHFLEADWGEMRAIWAGGPGPSAVDLADRRKQRLSLTWRDAPRFNYQSVAGSAR